MSKNTTECPLQFTMDLVGGKWKMITLWYMKDETLRFNEIKRRIPGNITQKMLTQLLRDLENDQIISREVYAEVPARVEYSLTDFGKSLLPILDKLAEWGESALEEKPAKEIRKDTETMEKQEEGLFKKRQHFKSRFKGELFGK